MRLDFIRLRNFRLHADTEIHFPPSGLTGIVGQNGCGKSTILEAVIWAFYGAAALRGTKASIRSFTAPARRMAEAVLSFEMRGSQYIITRTETHAEIVYASNGVPVASGTSAVNEYVPRLLGMTLPEFLNCYFATQKDIARLASMGPTERQVFFRNMMQISVVDVALKDCRARRNDLLRTHDGLRLGLGEREPLITECETAVAGLRIAEDALEAALGAEESAWAENSAAERAFAQVEYLKAQVVGMETTMAELRTAIAKEHTEIARVNQSILAARTAADAVAGYSRELERLPELLQQREQLRNARATLTERNTIVAALDRCARDAADFRERIADGERQATFYDADAHARDEESVQTLGTRIGELVTERNRTAAEASAQMDTNEAELKKLRRKLEIVLETGEEGDCPVCTRKLAEFFSIVADSLEADIRAREAIVTAAATTIHGLRESERQERTLRTELEEVQRRVKVARGRKEDADLGRRNAERARNALAESDREAEALRARLATLPSIEYSEADEAKLKTQISQLEQMQIEAAGARAVADKLPGLLQDLAARNDVVTDATDRIGQLTTSIAELGFSPEAYDAASARAAESRVTHNNAREARAGAEQAITAAVTRRDRAAGSLASYDERAAQLDRVAQDLQLHTETAERLDAFRLSLTAGIRPELEELTSGFLSRLTDGRHEAVTITEDFDLILRENGLDVEVVSGGTEDVAALCLRLAISHMIAARAGHTDSLLILDETFGSLDAERQDNVLALLRTINETFPQIILITHVAEAKQSVDHCIQVQYDHVHACSRVHAPSLAPASAHMQEVLV